jgi:hypothetical protein
VGRLGVARRFNGGEEGRDSLQSRFAGRLIKRGISIPPEEHCRDGPALYQGMTSVMPIERNKITGFSPCIPLFTALLLF